jgi:hypothetical protein
MTIASGRDLALIYFMIPAIIVSALPLVALFFAVKGLRIGRRKMMPYIHLAQFYANRVSRMTHRASDAVARPFIVVSGIGRQVSNVTSQIKAFIQGTEGS